MAKYHIKADGNPGICKAAEGKCPYGAETKHFENKKDAQAYAEEKVAERFNLTEEEKAQGIVEIRKMSEGEYKEFKKLAMKLRKTEITEFAKDFLKENFDMELDIPIKSRKLGNGVLGQYSQRFYGNVLDEEFITLNTNALYMYANGDHADVEEIMKHELTHFALSRQGKHYEDGQDDFENKLAELDIVSSYATSADKKKSTKKFTKHIRVSDEYTDYDFDGNVKEVGLYRHSEKPVTGPLTKRTGIVLKIYDYAKLEALQKNR